MVAPVGAARADVGAAMTGLEIVLLFALLVCAPIAIGCGYQFGRAAAHREMVADLMRSALAKEPEPELPRLRRVK